MIVTCHCRHCNGALQFDPAEYDIKSIGPAYGKEVTCPTCANPTLAFIPPSRAITKPNRTPWIILTIAVIFCLVVAALYFAAPAVSMLGLFVFGFVFYFIPSLVAMKKRNFAAILLLNIFLGWTFVGWVVALVWAATKDPAG
jgi:hypothetical protein